MARKLTKPITILKSYRFWLAIALIICILLCIFGPLKVIFNQDYLVEKIQSHGKLAALKFIFTYILLTIIGIPGTILTIAGGIVFGLFWGTLWSVVGATLGAIGAFWTARYLLHGWIERKLGKHKALVKFKQAVVKKPLTSVLVVRFAPISPFNIVNFLFGLTPINWLPYSTGTFFGIIPGTLAYTWLGVSGLEAWQGGEKLSFYLALGFLTLLSLLPLLAKKASRDGFS
ncbi:MAG: TVP38/TMEM64 family protein [Spirulinaceae cyanobacterium]